MLFTSAISANNRSLHRTAAEPLFTLHFHCSTVLLQTNRSTLISLHSDFNLMAVNQVFEKKCLVLVHICNLSKIKVPIGVVLITSKSLVALLTLSNLSSGASPLSYVAILTNTFYRDNQ